MVSLCIPFRNEFSEIGAVIDHLRATIPDNDYEIIVCNDGSVEFSGKFRPLELEGVKVINSHLSFGVGAAFDRCVEQASGDILVLMGADVFPHEGWYEKVLTAVGSNPNTLGCAVCVGDKAPFHKYYGADLLFTMGNDDLPLHSKLRERKGGYTDLFRGKWADKKGDEPYEISCLMGAFYFTSKEYYQKIHGWDSEPRNRYCGHRVWGHLEPFISLKSWLHGGGCMMYPDIFATHIFTRPHSMGGRSAEWQFWNVCWMLDTMVLSDFTRHRLEDFMHPELNWNVARRMIKQNYPTIERYRERNRLEFKNDLSIFTDKFQYKFF